MDVITCVAPNLRTIPHNRVNPNTGKKADISYQELKKLHRSRNSKNFEVAVANKAEVLLLGAFGCGAFRSPPPEIFDVIEYAVYHTGCETANYEAFRDARGRFL